MKVKFKRLSFHTCVPTKSTPDSACFNSYSARDVSLRPDVTKTVELGSGFKFANKYVCRIQGLAYL